MYKKARFLAHGALIAALYVVLAYLQNFIFPDSSSFAIQFRAAEALCVLALFTRAAIPGLRQYRGRDLAAQWLCLHPELV